MMPKTIVVDFYWMPYCPYGQTAARQLLECYPPTEDIREVQFSYIAHEHTAQDLKTRNPAPALRTAVPASTCEHTDFPAVADFGNFSSLHGRKETEESIRQLVIREHWPALFRRYLSLFLENPEGNWFERAVAVGIPGKSLEHLVTSPDGAHLLSENVRRARQANVNQSPTLVLNSSVVERLPQTLSGWEKMLCESGALKTKCAGNLCSSKSPCPPRSGYVSFCESGACRYQIAPQRSDAVEASLIIPRNCVPAEEFPVAEALHGWGSYLKLLRVDLKTPEAQRLLAGGRITSFPTLVVNGELANRAWGAGCIKELGLKPVGDHFIVSMEYHQSPFSSYAEVSYKGSGVEVVPNHYAGALILHQAGNLPAAAKSYRLALVTNPQDYRAWNNLGAILYQRGLKQSAEAMFRAAATLDSAYEPSLKNLLKTASERNDLEGTRFSKVRLGWLAIEEKRWGEAKTLLSDVVGDRTLEFGARKGLAYIAVREGRLKDALDELELCLLVSPKVDGDFSNLLAGVYYRRGEFKNAQLWYEKATADASVAVESYTNLCHLFKSLGQWEKLLAATESALSLNPQDTSLWFLRAEGLGRCGRSEEAIQTLRKISTLSPQAALRANYELAICYHRESRAAETTFAARQFIERVAQIPTGELHDECVEIGKIATQYGNEALAVDALLQSLRAKPSDAATHLRLAECYQRLGNTAESREHFQLAEQFSVPSR